MVSFWRGAWYILDENLFPENAFYSATASLGLGTTGLMMTHSIADSIKAAEASYQKNKRKVSFPSNYSQLRRFGGLYCLSISVVSIWRGTWMMWDIGYERFHKDEVKATDPGHLQKSGSASHLFGVMGLLTIGRFSSVLAPPASISMIKDTFARINLVHWKGPAKEVMKRLFR